MRMAGCVAVQCRVLPGSCLRAQPCSLAKPCTECVHTWAPSVGMLENKLEALLNATACVSTTNLSQSGFVVGPQSLTRQLVWLSPFP